MSDPEGAARGGQGAERVSVADGRLVLVRRIERRRRVDSIGDDGLLRGRASITHCVVERTLDFESLTVQFSGTVGNARHPPARALRYAYVTVITSNVTITITLRSETRDYGNGNRSDQRAPLGRRTGPSLKDAVPVVKPQVKSNLGRKDHVK